MFRLDHPSETAGDGKRVTRRTTYKRGDREIELIRCAQCGFFFRDGIDAEGDSQDSPTITQSLQALTVTNQNPLPQPLKNMAAFAYGATIDRIYDQTLSGGCRFCGSLNVRASGRTKDPFSASHRSMENQ